MLGFTTQSAVGRCVRGNWGDCMVLVGPGDGLGFNLSGNGSHVLFLSRENDEIHTRAFHAPSTKCTQFLRSYCLLVRT